MRRDTYVPVKSSFYSCEKDAETILRKLFVDNKQHSDLLKRLLVLNVPDCLDLSNESYQKIVSNTSLKDIIERKYVTLVPKIKMEEHNEVQSYIILTFDNFVTTYSNPEYRDCTVSFDILCPTDYWDLGDYKMRPLKIAGIIDGILNQAKLAGIGTLQFLSCNMLVINEDLSGYSLTYQATHGGDDVEKIE